MKKPDDAGTITQIQETCIWALVEKAKGTLDANCGNGEKASDKFSETWNCLEAIERVMAGLNV